MLKTCLESASLSGFRQGVEHMLKDIRLKDFPHSSGVYMFKDVDGEIIYVGSSKDLHNRMTDHRVRIKKGNCHGCKEDLYQFLQNNQFTVEFTLEENYKQLEQELLKRYNPNFNQRRSYTGCGSKKGRKAEYMKGYHEKYKEEIKQQKKQYDKQYYSRLCNYKGEILRLNTLAMRFQKAGIPHPVLEAKKYLIVS